MDMRSKTVYISIQNIQEIAHTHASASVFLRLKEGVHQCRIGVVTAQESGHLLDRSSKRWGKR